MTGKFARKIAIVLAAIAGFVASPAVFAIKNQVCPNCSVDRMIVAARAFGPGTIYIWDPYNGDVRKYVSYCGGAERVNDDKLALRVETAPSPYGACTGQSMATDEVPVEPQYADVAPHLGKIWVATNGTWVIGRNLNTLKGVGNSRGLRVPLPPGFGGYHPQNPTAQDFMTDAVLRAQVRDFVDTNGLGGAPSWVQAAVAYVKANINATMAYTQGITMNFEVVFPDGSSLVFNQALSGLPNYLAESGRDTAGYLIPEANTANYAGNWNYDPSHSYARGRLIDLLERLNANINYMDAHGYRIRCTWDGHTLHCTVRR